MIIFLLFTSILVLLYFIGFINQEKIIHTWMDRNYTIAIKGISILTVMWAHTGASLGVGGIQFIAGVGVSLFLIFSGYGLEQSFQKNGLRSFWTKRVLNVFVPCVIVDVISSIIEGTPIRVFTNWYMTYILLCYFIFYFIKLFVLKYNLLKIQIYLLMCVFAVWFVIESTISVDISMPFLQARQMMSFVTGIYIAINQVKVKKFIDKHTYLLCFLTSFCAVLCMIITQLDVIKNLNYIISNFISLGTVLPLAIMILVFTNKYTKILENKYIYFTGLCSYELYLIHFQILPIIKNNLQSVFLFLVSTYILAYIYNNLIGDCETSSHF
ncbi:MAG: acyltransferase family protein [Lachnospiraceae bacterium]